jgi:23S rRNA pseudouridine2605 synthase
MAQERIQKLISNAGFCSRRKAEELIIGGKVKVNDHVAKIGEKADPEKDSIYVLRRKINFAQKRYIAFNKPKHVLTTLSDPFKRKTVMNFFNRVDERIFPVGRLDFDAEGLILLTNDGDFANRVMHPRYELVKIYRAKLDQRVSEDEIRKLKGKVMLKDGPVRVEFARLINKTHVEIGVHEGRNKIVKRIFKGLGFYVDELKRVAIGPISLGTLKSGRWRELKEIEVRAVMDENGKVK